MEFYQHTKALLLADEIGNSALLSVIARGDPPRVASFVERDGAPVCAIYRTRMPFGNLAGSVDLEKLADSLPLDALEGVYGRKGPVEIFADRFCARAGKTKRLDLEMLLYACDAVKLPPLPRGVPRLATEPDLPLLEKWHEEFAAEAGVHPPPGTAASGISRKTIHLWDDGGPRCMTTLTEATPRIARIGWVYTPPTHRKIGYASALVAQLTQRSLADGRHSVTLSADVKNPASNSIYQRIGYTERGITRVYEFK
jgi:predicted GNAT family acetyltransferase